MNKLVIQDYPLITKQLTIEYYSNNGENEIQKEDLLREKMNKNKKRKTTMTHDLKSTPSPKPFEIKDNTTSGKQNRIPKNESKKSREY